MALVFWIAVALLAYSYVGHCLVVLALSKLRPRPVRQGSALPKVTVVIAAYNEEAVIADRILNTLALDYPSEYLEILVAADGSNDRTVQIAQGFSAQGVRVLHRPERRGKTAALNRAVAVATGDIILFVDANTRNNADAIRALVRHFSDPEVGGVSGCKSIWQNDERFAARGEGLFWKYESWLKTLESQVGSIATADGEIFAVRRELFRPIPEDIIHDDMALTLDLIQRGFRIVYEREALSTELASKRIVDEFYIKTRMAEGGFQILSKFRSLFFPPRTLFAFFFFSHKVLRWLTPVWMIAAFGANLFLVGPFYRATLAAELLFCVMALAGYLRTRNQKNAKAFYLPFYFSLAQVALLNGLRRALAGTHGPAWHRAER